MSQCDPKTPQDFGNLSESLSATVYLDDKPNPAIDSWMIGSLLANSAEHFDPYGHSVLLRVLEDPESDSPRNWLKAQADHLREEVMELRPLVVHTTLG